MKNFLSANKYKNRRIKIGGVRFDSLKELRRWNDLCLLEEQGIISNLKRQVRYTLIPAQRETETVTPRGRRKPGKVIERECFYVADFVYEQDGQTVVEDTKGYKTADYVIKRKLMLWVHGIRIREI